MEYDVVIFWFVVISCASGLVALMTRLRFAFSGWTALYSAILLLALAGHFLEKSILVYASLGLWVLLVLVPAILARVFFRELLKQRYGRAEFLARVICLVHPVDGWRGQPKIARALKLGQKGELTEAIEILRQFEGKKSLISLVGMTNLYRMTQQWEEMVAWYRENQRELDSYPQMLPVLLRALGETGDIQGLVELYDRNQRNISRLAPSSSRDFCRLVLFAFCGERQLVQNVMKGSLSILPDWAGEFWAATAEIAAGAKDAARGRLEGLRDHDDHSIRAALERRLSRLGAERPDIGPDAQRVIAEAAKEQVHDESFGAQVSMFSKYARATQLLLVLNVLMFVVEMYFGGATNSGTLFRLGAVYAPAIRQGEWWRLIAALFLHLGPLHLGMNMVALWLLGPFTERSLGFLRYFLLYLVAGVGSMGAVVVLVSAGRGAEQLTLGASGCVMGLVGATGALMFRAWRRHRAVSARRRLVAVIVIVGTQTLFDILVPQVSMTAHLSGCLIGFLMALGFRDRLTAKSPIEQAS